MHKKGSMKKVVKSKVEAQKWLWWSDNGKVLNNNNSDEFWCRFQVGRGNTNLPELFLLKTLRASTFDFTTFFMLPFFAWAAVTTATFF